MGIAQRTDLGEALEEKIGEGNKNEREEEWE